MSATLSLVASLVVGICGADQDPAIAAGKKKKTI
jgi:hypothetical protein